MKGSICQFSRLYDLMAAGLHLEESIYQFSDPAIFTYVRPEWSSLSVDHRLNLRKYLHEILLKLGLPDDQLQHFLAGQSRPLLGSPPIIPGFSISISHCRTAGGFALVKSLHEQIGFDLEEPSRVSPKVVARISERDEVSSAPSSAHLWVAKEAAFKAMLGFNQPQFMSVVKISSWQQINDREWVFQARAPAHPNFKGRVELIAKVNLIVSLCRLPLNDPKMV